VARDFSHDVVRKALEKDHWQITDDPLKIVVGADFMLIDLAAERLLLAERGQEFIAVEIKGLSQTSSIHQFHAVLGQYLNYRLALRLTYPQYKLYLAVPEETFNTFYQREFSQLVIQEHHIAIMVYDVENEVIVHEYP
jgi:XisH protein